MLPFTLITQLTALLLFTIFITIKSISVFDKFTKYVNALSWPFQACKINAYGRAPCLRCVIQPACEETLGEEPDEEDESIASIHPRQLFMNIKEQL